MAGSANPLLWIERISGKLGLSFGAGVVLLGTLPPTLAFFVGNLVTGAYNPLDPLFVWNVFSAVMIIPVPLVCLFGAKYISTRIKSLMTYAKSLGASDEAVETRGLGSIGHLALVWVALSALIFFVLLDSNSSAPKVSTPVDFAVIALLFFPPVVYTVLIVATLVWTFAYSMWKIHRLGLSPLNLGFFGKDRTLGLGPFGQAAFQLTLVYMTASVILFVSLNAPPLPLFNNLFLLSFFFLAIPLFLLPLRTLRSQLLAARKTEMQWVGERYERIFNEIKKSEGPELPDSLKSELTTVRELQDDIRKTHSWPFDTAVLARLIAVILSVSAILLSAYIRDYLKF